MTRARSLAAVAALALGLGCAPSTARAAGDTSTELGLEAAIVAGTHVGADNPVPVSGVVPGALLEVAQHVGRFALAFEGIPTVAATSGTIGPFGRSSASLFLLNTRAIAELGAARRYRVGLGYQIVDLTNHNGSNGDRNAVRIASPIYAVGASLPFARGAIDLDADIDPNLRGVLHIFSRAGVAATDKPEAGAEIDYRAAYRWTRGATTYRAGVRGLSYHTRNLANGELVDRNVGAGATFDVRFALGGS